MMQLSGGFADGDYFFSDRLVGFVVTGSGRWSEYCIVVTRHGLFVLNPALLTYCEARQSPRLSHIQDGTGALSDKSLGSSFPSGPP